MEDQSLKTQLINNYLSHQVQSNDIGPSDMNENALTTVELPDNASLEEFKNQVRIWIELDNNIKKIKQDINEKNNIKKELTNQILRFMIRFNIEDLNTKDGSKLRYKVSQVKVKPSTTDIKNRMSENFDKVKTAEELVEKVLLPTKKSEKPTLRRLTVKNAS